MSERRLFLAAFCNAVSSLPRVNGEMVTADERPDPPGPNAVCRHVNVLLRQTNVCVREPALGDTAGTPAH